MSDVICIIEDTQDSELTVVRWLKEVGDRVSRDEAICEVSTAKATVEITSPSDGILVSIFKNENEATSLGEVLGRVSEIGLAGEVEIIQTNSLAPTPEATSKKLTPAVRKFLKERGLASNDIKGSARPSRILANDIPSNIQPHSSMRSTIANRVSESLLRVAPHVTAVFECNLSAVLEHIAYSQEEDRLNSIKRTVTPYFIKAASVALSEVPQVNSQWHDDGLELIPFHNIGLVVSLESEGLIIPVIENVEEKSLSQIAVELMDIKSEIIAERYHHRLSKRGTFSISNYGALGGLFSAPIVINQPQSAVLGVGKIERRVRVSEVDRVVIVPMVYASLTIDHRVLDAYHANRFMTKFDYVLQNPNELNDVKRRG